MCVLCWVLSVRACVFPFTSNKTNLFPWSPHAGKKDAADAEDKPGDVSSRAALNNV